VPPFINLGGFMLAQKYDFKKVEEGKYQTWIKNTILNQVI
jgi:hypothetical protein